MAADVCSSRSPSFERACREIHDTWGRLNHLCEALARRTAGERRQIREVYKAMYGEDLVERLHKDHAANPDNEMAGAVCMWMLDPLERDAVVARRALECMDTQYRALVEIYACRKSNQLFYINRAYQARFKRSLDQDIISQPSHSYQRILVALAASHKSHSTDVSQHIAKCDAKRLYEAGKGGTGAAVDEPVVLELFKFQDALRLAVKCMCDPPKYFSKVLYMSMKGTIADRSALSRVIIGRAEVDMKEIKDAFENKYGMKLQGAIRENIQNKDLQSFLLSLTASSM
ncbi:hypothetical protein Taro_012545 [Colocasia esculenta]|uniref:Annexin n=1 Tax=Colocasia esculenta TaxID=4460 RepID=A0A843UJJ1_COLES|nr:hypothetical protein [Colocasia esculenta]